MKNIDITNQTLQVLEILKFETDELHVITQKQLSQKLQEKGYISNTYIIEKCLKNLKKFGYPIVTIKGYGTFFKSQSITADDVFVLIESLKRANFNLEKGYIVDIKNKLKSKLNKFQLDDLESKNMIL